jgi:hypothetical protein
VGNERTGWPGNFDTGQPHATGHPDSIGMNRGYCNSVNLSHLSDKNAYTSKVLKSQYLIKNRRVSVARQSIGIRERSIPENRGERESLIRGYFCCG